MFRNECIDFVRKITKSMHSYSKASVIIHSKFIYIISDNYICRIKVIDKLEVMDFLKLEEDMSTLSEIKSMDIFKGGVLNSLIKVNNACERRLDNLVRIDRQELVGFLQSNYKTPSKLNKVLVSISSSYEYISVICAPKKTKSRVATCERKFSIVSNSFTSNRISYEGDVKCNAFVLFNAIQDGIEKKYVNFEYSNESLLKIRERKMGSKDICWLVCTDDIVQKIMHY